MIEPFYCDLTWAQVEVGYHIGGLRRIASLQRNLKERGGADTAKKEDQVAFNILGALGEIAAAKALRRFWFMGINDQKGVPDLSPDIEVRTRSQDDWDLKLYKDSPIEHRYVLVVGHEPHFRIAGWIWGHEAFNVAEEKDYGDRGSPALWVAQDKLHDAHELITN